MGKRIHSIDAMRIIAMVFIVMVHTDPFNGLGATGNMAHFIIDSMARFAVPFFFMASGYFFAIRLSQRDPGSYVRNRVTALASMYGYALILAIPIFLAITAISSYIAGQPVGHAVLSQLAEYLSPAAVLYYGNSVSEILWFIVALMYSYIFIYAFVKYNLTAFLLPVALAFHLLGVMGEGYTIFLDVPLETRDGLFFGFFYTSLGYYISNSEWQPNPDHSHLYLGATAVFAGVNVLERYALGYVAHGMTFEQGVFEPEYTLGAVLVTLSLFLYLLTRPSLFQNTALPDWGRDYAIGIYIIHGGLLVLQNIASTVNPAIPNTLVWHLVFTPATFGGAALVYITMARLGLVEIGDFRPVWLSRVKGRVPNRLSVSSLIRNQ